MPTFGSHEVALVNQLANELLVEIVMYAASHETENSKAVMVINQLSGVCCYWREVLLGTAQLWSRLSYGRHRDGGAYVLFRDLCLRRSLKALLHIEGRFWNEEETEMSKLSILLREESYRVRSLNLRLPTMPSLDLCHRFLIPTTNLPVLMQLEISTSYIGSWSPPLSARLLALTSDMYPRLCRFRLEGYHVPWDSGVFSNLVDLVLLQGSDCGVDTFLNMLEASPNLERLVLHRTGPCIHKGSPSSSTREVSLLHLKFLNIEHEHGNIACLLAHLVLPATVSIRLSTSLLPDTQLMASYGGTLFLHPRRDPPLPNLADSTILYLCLDDTSCHILAGKYNERSSCFIQKLRLHIEYPEECRRSKFVEGILSGVSQLFSGVPIITLDFAHCARYIWETHYRMYAENWVPLLRSFPRLEHIVIRPHRDISDCRSFWKVLSMPPSTDLSEMLCRRLKTVSMKEDLLKQDLKIRAKCLRNRAAKGIERLEVFELKDSWPWQLFREDVLTE